MKSVRKKATSDMNTFFPMNDTETVLLIDSRENQEALDIHHKSSMMARIIALRAIMT